MESQLEIEKEIKVLHARLLDSDNKESIKRYKAVRYMDLVIIGVCELFERKEGKLLNSDLVKLLSFYGMAEKSVKERMLYSRYNNYFDKDYLLSGGLVKKAYSLSEKYKKLYEDPGNYDVLNLDHLLATDNMFINHVYALAKSHFGESLFSHNDLKSIILKRMADDSRAAYRYTYEFLGSKRGADFVMTTKEKENADEKIYLAV